MARPRKNPETPAADKGPKPVQTAQERALAAVRTAFEKYDKTQDRAIEADKRAAELHAETAYLRKVFLHAGAHPDLPDDFDAEQYIANEQAEAEVVTTDTPTPVAEPVTEEVPVTSLSADSAPKDEPIDEDDPFAGV